MDCYNAAKEFGVPIMQSGGYQIFRRHDKALAAGANVCMMGSMFAGCDEAPGTFELYQEENTKYTAVWDLLQPWRTEVKTVTSRKVRRNWFRKVWKAV